MVRIGCLTMVLCVFSTVASAQEDPLAWFPLQVGSRWVYEHEWKSGDRNRPDVDRWTTEETITGWVTIPEGLVVLREVKQQGNANEETITHRVIAPNGQLRYVQQGNTHSGYLITRASGPYLFHGNCIYVVGGDWDGQKAGVSPGIPEVFERRRGLTRFLFPFADGPRVGEQ